MGRGFNVRPVLKHTFPRTAKDARKKTMQVCQEITHKLDRDLQEKVKSRKDLAGVELTPHHILQILHTDPNYSCVLNRLGVVCITGATQATMLQYSRAGKKKGGKKKKGRK
jgi:hypothetical protein